jgi:hypothetical protein
VRWRWQWNSPDDYRYASINVSSWSKRSGTCLISFRYFSSEFAGYFRKFFTLVSVAKWGGIYGSGGPGDKSFGSRAILERRPTIWNNLP